MTFRSILFAGHTPPDEGGAVSPPDCIHDLNVDQIIDTLVRGRDEYDLTPFFHCPLHDRDLIEYRQAVMQDLERPDVFRAVREFATGMREVRRRLQQAEDLRYPLQSRRWMLDAAHAYCRTVRALRDGLHEAEFTSDGLKQFLAFLADYVEGEPFRREETEIDALYEELGEVHYAILIGDGGFDVRRYAGEPDYSAKVEQVFRKFKEAEADGFAMEFKESVRMNHVEAKVLEFVARLHPGAFEHLAEFCDEYGGYQDATVKRFDREIQFYLAYIEHMGRHRRNGLHFCYPAMLEGKAGVHASDTFDLALADNLLQEKGRVVTNEFRLDGEERVIVVSGPNQGGKTTFARTVGQLHYLASLGFPVPGRDASLLLYDRLFTHFEKQESMENLRGKLEDDLYRIRRILESATSRSLIILNEIFHSTTARDAEFLTTRIVDRIIALDALCVCVTFIDEISRLGEATVSMVATVVEDHPEQRTFRIVRRRSDGLAYAMSLAEKHGLTYRALQRRL